MVKIQQDSPENTIWQRLIREHAFAVLGENWGSAVEKGDGLWGSKFTVNNCGIAGLEDGLNNNYAITITSFFQGQPNKWNDGTPGMIKFDREGILVERTYAGMGTANNPICLCTKNPQF